MARPIAHALHKRSLSPPGSRGRPRPPSDWNMISAAITQWKAMPTGGSGPRDCTAAPCPDPLDHGAKRGFPGQASDWRNTARPRVNSGRGRPHDQPGQLLVSSGATPRQCRRKCGRTAALRTSDQRPEQPHCTRSQATTRRRRAAASGAAPSEPTAAPSSSLPQPVDRVAGQRGGDRARARARPEHCGWTRSTRRASRGWRGATAQGQHDQRRDSRGKQDVVRDSDETRRVRAQRAKRTQQHEQDGSREPPPPAAPRPARPCQANTARQPGD